MFAASTHTPYPQSWNGTSNFPYYTDDCYSFPTGTGPYSSTSPNYNLNRFNYSYGQNLQPAGYHSNYSQNSGPLGDSPTKGFYGYSNAGWTCQEPNCCTGDICSTRDQLPFPFYNTKGPHLSSQQGHDSLKVSPLSTSTSFYSSRDSPELTMQHSLKCENKTEPEFSSPPMAAQSTTLPSPMESSILHDKSPSTPLYCPGHRQDPNNKPPYSYITLIVSAMRSKGSKRITLNEIYAWIMSNFTYYRKNVRRWQNSIRHALSFNDCFVKVPRPPGEAGKGHYWTVHPDALDMFDNGSSMRRNRKFVDEHKEAVRQRRRLETSSHSYLGSCSSDSEDEKEQLVTSTKEITSPPDSTKLPEKMTSIPRDTNSVSSLQNESLQSSGNNFGFNEASFATNQQSLPSSMQFGISNAMEMCDPTSTYDTSTLDMLKWYHNTSSQF